MRALALVSCLLVLHALPATAQENTPLVELAGAYSVVNADGRQFNGWLASGSVSIMRAFGVTAEAGVNHHTERFTFIDGQEYTFRSKRKFYGLGPRVVARGRTVTGFAHVLVGAEDTFGKNMFALQPGGGVDVWVVPAFAVRAGVDGRINWYEDEQEGSWRFHVGGVVALGSR